MEHKKVMQIKNKKDFAQLLIGIGILIIVFIINGLLSFVTLGFSFETLKTGEYWANFALLFASQILTMYGMYLVRKRKDIENNKITTIQKDIDIQRNVVYGVDKVSEAENWLRDIYNYREKLNIYEKHIDKLRETCKLVKPQENEKHYKKKIKRYNEDVEKKEYCIKQYKFIKIDKERLSLMIKKSQGLNVEFEELEKQINSDEYGFKRTKIKYQDVYWGNLLSDIEETQNKPQTPFFSEKKELSKKAIKKLASGIVTSGLMSGLLPPLFNQITWGTLLSLLLRTCAILIYMAFGVLLSKEIVLGTYYRALEKRKSIYNQMLQELNISQIEIEGDIYENKEI